MRLKAAQILLCCMFAAACGNEQPGGGPAPAGGDARNGKLLLRQFGCGTCHRIPGVVAADGTTGPPLASVGKRVYIAGSLPNTPENMARWIRNPKGHEPRTAMPDLQVTEAHARDMVAYLRTLE
jgi:cytochrome c1